MTGILTHIWLILIVNVGKYTIDGFRRIDLDIDCFSIFGRGCELFKGIKRIERVNWPWLKNLDGKGTTTLAILGRFTVGVE